MRRQRRKEETRGRRRGRSRHAPAAAVEVLLDKRIREGWSWIIQSSRGGAGPVT